MLLYLVQWLSSEIKLRICTALGMTKYPNSPLSQAWLKITKGSLILNITLVEWKGVQAQRLYVRIGHGDWQVT